MAEPTAACDIHLGVLAGAKVIPGGMSQAYMPSSAARCSVSSAAEGRHPVGLMIKGEVRRWSVYWFCH